MACMSPSPLMLALLMLASTYVQYIHAFPIPIPIPAIGITGSLAIQQRQNEIKLSHRSCKKIRSRVTYPIEVPPPKY